MDVVPAAVKSRRPRHVRRVPSPDSACEQASSEDPASDLSEEAPRNAKGVACQDSDVDSGIVTCRKPGQRIGSTSSADTDSSQESRRRIEYSPPIPKNEVNKSRNYVGSLRIPRRSSCLSQSGGPIKADHSALKECNRRPPTPLTVFPDSHQCVRFDEQLQLSEQNIRRSCRKLFATLYAQRFHPDALLCGGRMRSRTVPELELRRPEDTCKENLGPAEARRSVGWGRAVHKSVSDASIGGKGTPSLPRYRFHTHSRFPLDFPEGAISHTNSTDSGLGSLRNSTHCTCHSSRPTTPSSHSHCTCPHHHHNNNHFPADPVAPDHISSPPKLFKSSSCSTLSHQSRPQLTQFPPRATPRKISLGEERPKSAQQQQLHKTSSCSSLLLDRTQSSPAAAVPVYSDNMVQVYARMASVIPDGGAGPQTGRRARTLGRRHQTTDSIPLEVVPRRKVNSFGNDVVLSSSDDHQDTKRVDTDTEVKSVHSVEIYSQIPDCGSDSFRRKSVRDSVQSRTSSNYQRPKSVGVVVPSCGPNPVYLKSALKKSTQSAMLHVKELSAIEQKALSNGISTTPSEVEYAIVDKSKKNRFTSEPVLNSSNNPSITVQEIEEKDPPVPPKKLLHKSDFSLYRSRSSSPKKGLLGRVQSLGRSARSALQKAFSTERIYRPEREERLEAGLRRSFIKGLTNSFRRKKKKQEEVVKHRASPNPEWDEQPSGPNSPIHVRGQLLQLNLDGSQVVELTKPQGKPYGFFVARGRVRNSKGIFVSRMRDQETQKHLAGLLDIGDEILEIDGVHVKDAEIMEVNGLMANKNTLLLTILPFICRKDI